MSRCTDSELKDRESAALAMLQEGYGTAAVALELSERFSVSLRQARRYVSVAALDLCNPATPAELDLQLSLTVYRLDLLAGRALQDGDTETCIKASKAHAQALAQFRRALSVPATRFRLPDARPLARVDGGASQTDPPDDLPDILPF